MTVLQQELMNQVQCNTIPNLFVIHFLDSAVPATPPENISAVEIDANSIEVTWLDPAIPYGVITSYSVKYNASYENVTSFITESQRATLEGLDEYTVYRIQVSAFTRVGGGPYAEVHRRTGQASK